MNAATVNASLHHTHWFQYSQKVSSGASSHHIHWFQYSQKVSIDEYVEKLKLSFIVVGNVKWNTNYGKQFEVPQKVKNKVTHVTNSTEHMYMLKRIENMTT